MERRRSSNSVKKGKSVLTHECVPWKKFQRISMWVTAIAYD